MSDKEIFNLIRAQVKPLKGAYLFQNYQKIHFTNHINFKEIEQLRLKYEK